MYKVFLIFHKEKNIKTGHLEFKGESIELNFEFFVSFIEFLRAFCRVFEAKNRVLKTGGLIKQQSRTFWVRLCLI
jgi:hypothetical protein